MKANNSGIRNRFIIATTRLQTVSNRKTADKVLARADDHVGRAYQIPTVATNAGLIIRIMPILPLNQPSPNRLRDQCQLETRLTAKLGCNLN